MKANINGKSSRKHFEPIFYNLSKKYDVNSCLVEYYYEDELEDTTSSVIDFIWTSSVKNRLALNPPLKVKFFNHLSNVQVFENKYYLAMIQQYIVDPKYRVTSFALRGRKQFVDWAEFTFKQEPGSIWVVKDAQGNSGSGVWVTTKKNWSDIVTNHFINDDDDKKGSKCLYAVQEHIGNLKLIDGRKLHYRVYGLITGDLRVFIHRLGFIHLANKKYQLPQPEDAVFDIEVHLTNQGVNSQNANLFDGERPIDFLDYTLLFENIKAVWMNLVESSSTFLLKQRSPFHFEYIGFDVLVDVNDRAYIIELNCPPGHKPSTYGHVKAKEWHEHLISDTLEYFVFLPNQTNEIYHQTLGGWNYCGQCSKGKEVIFVDAQHELASNSLTLALFDMRKGKWRKPNSL